MKNYQVLLVGLAALAVSHAIPAVAEDATVNFDVFPKSSTRRAEDAVSKSIQQRDRTSAQSTNRSNTFALSFDLPGDLPGLPDGEHPPFVNPFALDPDSDVVIPGQPDYTLDDLFVGGSDSLVATAVGSAEGTRTPEGDRTASYYGHTDPGNGVWNLGSFSYQHEAGSPQEADEKQLQRLQQQALTLKAKAKARGMRLTLEEKLNALDLANQAPLAALDRGGYLDWLEQAHQMGLKGPDAILWARVRSFLDPDTKRWNAPGLGNTLESISRDQERRMQEVAKAIAVAQQTRIASHAEQLPGRQMAARQEIVTRLLHLAYASSSTQVPVTQSISSESTVVDQILNMDLSLEGIY
jgi:hypothetical protein